MERTNKHRFHDGDRWFVGLQTEPDTWRIYRETDKGRLHIGDLHPTARSTEPVVDQDGVIADLAGALLYFQGVTPGGFER